MTLLAPWLLVRLQSALGLRPRLVPLAEGQVLGILRWWIELREGGAGDTGLVMPQHHRTEEPGWMLLDGTIAAKLSRLPSNPMVRDLPWACSAVEALLWAELAIDDEQVALGRSVARSSVHGEERDRRQRDVSRARQAMARLRESAAYRDGIEMLRWEFAAALQDDGAFREAVRRRVLTTAS